MHYFMGPFFIEYSLIDIDMLFKSAGINVASLYIQYGWESHA